MGEATAKELKFLQWAQAGAELFSTCAKHQYFAVILDVHGHVVGTGYNGGPKGMPHCTDGACPRFVAGSTRDVPHDANCFGIHAEANALLHSDHHDRLGGTMLTNGETCYGCAKLIANSGLRRLVWLDDGVDRERAKVEGFLEACGIESVACDL